MISFIAYVVKQIACGVPVWKISAPAQIHGCETALTMNEKRFLHNEEFINRIDNAGKSSESSNHCKIMLDIVLAFAFFKTTDDPNANNKPFNSVLGEFIDASVVMSNGVEIKFQIEQVSHHPPFMNMNLKGQDWNLTSPTGLGGDIKFTPGFTSISMQPINNTIELKTKNGSYTWNALGIRIENLYSSKRAPCAFGDLEISDPFGNILTCKVEKNKIAGEITYKNGNKRSFSGTGKEYRYLDGDKELITVEMVDKPLSKIVYNEIENETYSRKLWEPVFKAMKLKDYDIADQEKNKIEEAQRYERKQGIKFISKFGFEKPSLSTD